VVWTLTTDPLEVRVPELPVGASLTVHLATTATPACSDVPFTNVATATASNAMMSMGGVLVAVQGCTDICNGVDDDCDGAVDEGAAARCPTTDACAGAPVCAGAAGCQPGTPPDCDDHLPCTMDACDPSVGCTHTAVPGCVPCTSPSDCNDGLACTTDTCTD